VISFSLSYVMFEQQAGVFKAKRGDEPPSNSSFNTVRLGALGEREARLLDVAAKSFAGELDHSSGTASTGDGEGDDKGPQFPAYPTFLHHHLTSTHW
jgi:hypothetical protein